MFRLSTVLLLLGLASAHAAGAVDISLRGLDLASPADRQILAQRIGAAAEQVCGPVRYTADLRPSAMEAAESNHRACVRYASDKAMDRVQAIQTRLAGAPRVRFTRD